MDDNPDGQLCLQKIEKHIQRLLQMIGADSPKIDLQREILGAECERLMAIGCQDEQQRQALDYLWHHCWYQPIKRCLIGMDKSTATLTTKEDRAWLHTFVTCGTGRLAILMEKYPPLRFQLLIYIGDLHRYSYEYGGTGPIGLLLADRWYKKGIAASGVQDGRPFNQMALLHEREHPRKRLLLYLRALIMERPFHKALDNLAKMNDRKSIDEEWKDKCVYDLIKCALLEFEKPTFDGLAQKFIALCNDGAATGDDSLLLSVLCISILAIKVVRSKEVSDVLLRSVISVACECWSILLLLFKESTQRLSVLSGVAEFIWATNATLNSSGGRRLPVALKLQYQCLFKKFIDYLNHDNGAVIASLTEATDVNISSRPILDWLCDPSSTSQDVIVHFINQLSSILILEGDKFCAGGVEKIAQAIEGISKMEVAPQPQQQVPVFLFPDHNVLLKRLQTMKNLLTTRHRFTIIIAHSVLSQLDRCKKESAQAREAIRWLEGAIPKGRVRMSSSDAAPHLVDECVYLLKQKDLLQRHTLFAVILTTNIHEYVETGYEAMRVEDVDAFFTRIIIG